MAIAAASDDSPVIDVAELLDKQNVSRFNVLLIAIGWFAIFSDGFDISNIGYILPNLMKELHLGPETVGLISSASLIAYPIGSLGLGWLSDHYGRKLALIIGSLIVAIFTYSTVFVTSADGLAATRFLTGIGLGGIIPNIVALGSEFAPKRLRARLIIFTFCGINFGGFVCGLAAPSIIAAWGWRGLFYVGGTVPLVAVILMWLFMAESVKFLVLRGGREAELRRILALLIPNFSAPVGARFVVASQASRVPFRPSQLFAGGLAWITPILWVMFILNLFVIYFVGGWTNVVLQGAGMRPSDAIYVTSLNQGGGVLGGLVIAYFVDRFGFLSLIAWGILTAATVWLIGMPDLSVAWIAVWVAISGFGMQGLQYGLNATPGMIYPTSLRAFASGWAFGVARLGAVAGPIVGGFVLAAYQAGHLSKAEVAQNMFIVPVYALVAGVVLAIIAAMFARRQFRGYQFEEVATPTTQH